MPVLYGVFLYMGVASLNGVQVSFYLKKNKPRKNLTKEKETDLKKQNSNNKKNNYNYHISTN